MIAKKQIILNIRRNDIRVAVREDEELVEFYIERGDSSFSPGAIIKGKLIAIRKELNAVFVDIGARSAGFLPLNDFYLSLPHRKEDEEGLEFLVQIKKEPYGTKGARLTTFIAIPGRYLVLMPLKEAYGVSRKIKKDKDRRKLKMIAKELYTDGMGIIIRTASSGEDIRIMKSDLLELKKTWERIEKKSKTVEAPCVLWRDEELPIRMTRDLLDDSVSEFIVDSEEAFRKIKEYLSRKKSSLIKKVKLYKNHVPIFNHYWIEQELRSIFRRKIYLKSGGHIVIDETEALTVFDVNTGSYRGKEKTEGMIFKTNCESAVEIAR